MLFRSLNRRKPTGSPPKRTKRKKAKVKTPEKLPYKMTYEECCAISKAEVDAHFAKKKPKPR